MFFVFAFFVVVNTIYSNDRIPRIIPYSWNRICFHWMSLQKKIWMKTTVF